MYPESWRVYLNFFRLSVVSYAKIFWSYITNYMKNTWMSRSLHFNLSALAISQFWSYTPCWLEGVVVIWYRGFVKIIYFLFKCNLHQFVRSKHRCIRSIVRLNGNRPKIHLTLHPRNLFRLLYFIISIVTGTHAYDI